MWKSSPSASTCVPRPNTFPSRSTFIQRSSIATVKRGRGWASATSSPAPSFAPPIAPKKLSPPPLLPLPPRGGPGGLPPLTSAPAATEGRASRSERPAGRGEGTTQAGTLVLADTRRRRPLGAPLCPGIPAQGVGALASARARALGPRARGGRGPRPRALLRVLLRSSLLVRFDPVGLLRGLALRRSVLRHGRRQRPHPGRGSGRVARDRGMGSCLLRTAGLLEASRGLS